ncbi:alpha/beta hydrolase [Agrococcus sp. SCSIO52902]|uniref:alpha/beta fold hydrolase n=1 Tax=Agrococcus sp. SCSIO52902 TaxID=2933290 RepID=UPI001FF17898|nr:alpha/beta hydrolase [Agrococcus sp. SCSIO52902]UOW00836.1 alpha/beta hydrolase [Agrococcus sp. SCSIO52902]UOW00908.1 alpha/beta hydrolase [Agrococcus sp. SCSIO52902]
MTDIRLHIEDSGGDGRPVVLLHGWPLSAEAWAAQTAALTAAGHRVVAYDRRGFGRSDKPDEGYDYDTLAADLDRVLTELDLRDVALVGFSMGGGEVARYVSTYGEERVRSVVFAAAVPPYLLHADDNPEGPLTEEAYRSLRAGLEADREAFFDEFTTGFFSTEEGLQVSEAQRHEGIRLSLQSHQPAALGAMDAWATTDFRDDLGTITVPVLVLHGDGDQTVPFEGSGRRTHETIEHSELHVISGAPHGCNVSHADEFNRALIAFLG